MLEALNEQLLYVELIAADRTIPAQGQLAQELAESFQVLLDLADHARGATNLVGDLVELSFIDEQAPRENLRGDVDRPSDRIWMADVSDELYVDVVESLILPRDALC